MVWLKREEELSVKRHDRRDNRVLIKLPVYDEAVTLLRALRQNPRFNRGCQFLNPARRDFGFSFGHIHHQITDFGIS